MEHVFAVVKRLWGFLKVRYRGLGKNTSRAFTALALANIYLARHRLMAPVPHSGQSRLKSLQRPLVRAVDSNTEPVLLCGASCINCATG